MFDAKATFPDNFKSQADYLIGKAQNELIEGDGLGSPWHELVINNTILGPISAILWWADITPDGSEEKAGQSQYLDALRIISQDMNWGNRFVGSFARGVTFTDEYSVARGQDGKYYTYVGSDPFPRVVAAGINPSGDVDFEVIEWLSAESIIDENGGNVQNYIDGQQFDSIDAVKSYSKLSKLIGQQIKTKEYHSGTGYGGASYMVVSSSSVTPNGTYIIQGVADTSAAIVLRQTNTVFLDRYGAKWDGVTDNTSIYQSANDYITSVGGGDIVIPWFSGASSPAIGSTVIQDSLVKFKGLGDILTKVQALPSFSGTSMFKSRDFDTLTGSGAWLVSEGVKHGLGFDGIVLDGQFQSIKGVEYFAKRIMVGKLYIEKCSNGGWYSEAGAVTGQSGLEDMPESKVDYLSVRDCGGVSIDVYGPHDSIWGKLISRAPDVATGTIGVRFGTVENVSIANGDNDFIHVYGHENGIVVDDGVTMKCGLWISESCMEEGVILNGSACQVSKMELYRNNRSQLPEAYNLTINGFRNQIDNIRINDTDGGGAINITGTRNNISWFSVDGNLQAPPTSGSLVVSGSNNTVKGNIIRVSGLAFNSNPVNFLTGNQVDLLIENCDIVWNNEFSGTGDEFNIRANITSSQILFTGVRPKEGDKGVSFKGILNDVSYNLPSSNIALDSVQLDTTSLQTINIPINSPYQPYLRDCKVDLVRSSNVQDFSVAFIYIAATSPTQVTVQIQLSQASSSSGSTASLSLSVG